MMMTKDDDDEKQKHTNKRDTLPLPPPPTARTLDSQDAETANFANVDTAATTTTRLRMRDIVRRVTNLKRQEAAEQAYNKSFMAMTLLEQIGENDDDEAADGDVDEDEGKKHRRSSYRNRYRNRNRNSLDLDTTTELFTRHHIHVRQDEAVALLQGAGQEEEEQQVLNYSRTGLPRYGSIDNDSSDSDSDARTSSMRHCWRYIQNNYCSLCCFGRSRRHQLQSSIRNLVLHTILGSYFCLLGLPLLLLSWILLYHAGNPELDFLPGEARLSWWCHFLARQVATLQLALFFQWLVIDVAILHGGHGLHTVLGPFLTLLCIQSKGWPFLLTAWSLWDLLLLYGDNKFQQHWLGWTGWGIFQQPNSGNYILASNEYLRILLCMLIAGCATCGKRYFVAVHFGRRSFVMFKDRFEKLLADVVLVSEIGTLAQQAITVLLQEKETTKIPTTEPDGAQTDDVTKKTVQTETTTPKQKLSAIKPSAAAVKWGSVRFEHGGFDDDDGNGDDDNEKGDDDDDGKLGFTEKKQHWRATLSTTESGTFNIINLLDGWVEPVNKLDNKLSNEVTIKDVLKFKRALTLMDDSHPFGHNFGPAGTREECIASSNIVFHNLLMLSDPNLQEEVPFDILALIAIDESGAEHLSKKKALRNLFRPKKSDQLSRFIFIQVCDSVYKRIRYFRASVGNASVIDNVLENVVNGIFFFVLALILLSLLQYEPWALLVSMTSLLVSISFAFGQSIAKYVEGTLLIAVRRPFDLGDRIFLCGAETPAVQEISNNSFFVEDINITTTTLRYARTNEVSTVNNWSIAGSRIVNCNRSPNAVIDYKNTYHIDLLKGDKLARFRESLETYVTDNPRTWERLLFCRHDFIDADNEIVALTIAFLHRQSWQDAGRIKLSRADLLRYIHETADELGVNVDTPAARRIIYQGGSLEHGEVLDYKRNLMKPSNILTQRKLKDASFGDRPIQAERETSFGDKPVLAGD